MVSQSCAAATHRHMGKNKQRKPAGVASKGTVPWWATYAIGAVILAAAVPPVLKFFTSPTSTVPAANAARGKVTESVPKVDPTTACLEGADHYMCPAWHKAGMCRDPQLRQKCMRTCGGCPNVSPRNPKVTREDRCRRDNVSAAVPAGQLNRLFERVLTQYPQYEPEALSTAPYVVLLKNFVTSEEAAAFLRVCQKSFERSLAGDQLNPVRTSYQCWCNFPECFADPVVHRVTSRINDLLNIPCAARHIFPWQPTRPPISSRGNPPAPPSH